MGEIIRTNRWHHRCNIPSMNAIYTVTKNENGRFEVRNVYTNAVQSTWSTLTQARRTARDLS